MYKILVSDFDNTLYTTEMDLLQNIIKITKFINDGNIFVIATGRSYIDISKMIIKYNIPYNYLICNDGGTIFNNHGKLLYKQDIPINTAYSIIEYLKFNQLLELTYIDSGYDYSRIIEKEVNAIIIKDINKTKSKKILDDIENIFKNVHGYISDNWINITEKTVNKSNGIKQLAKIINIDYNNIYTIGDSINDISMTKHYNGFCMSNSKNDLKAYCTKCFDSVKNCIDYIEKI